MLFYYVSWDDIVAAAASDVLPVQDCSTTRVRTLPRHQTKGAICRQKSGSSSSPRIAHNRERRGGIRDIFCPVHINPEKTTPGEFEKLTLRQLSNKRELTITYILSNA